MKSEPKYDEPLWNYTTLMEAMLLKGIKTVGNSLSFNQMIYVFNTSDIDTQMVLNHLVDERFFKRTAKGYYLDDLGVFHAKKRMNTFEESVKESKGNSEKEGLVNFILETRERFMQRIDEATKSSIGKRSSPTLEERVSELERKFNMLGDVFSKR